MSISDRILHLSLTLRDDLVASERPATEGGHESLDYIPGAMLLGAVAARLYASCTGDEAYRLFHSGAVCFGDGVPLHEGLPCWPLPLCWHKRKGDQETGEDGRIVPDRVRNFQFGRFPDGTQPQQLRQGYVREDGCPVSLDKSLRMKTAIDPRTGRVAEAQLFGYEAILAGQVFAATIQADPSLSDALWKRVTDLFAKPSEILLGRSRSAEFGRVQAASTTPGITLPAAVAPTSTLTLWCLSDLALLDAWGQPTLCPAPGHFGIQRGSLDPARSFLRFRRFAPWNAFRRAFDLQRQVIRRGSIIALTGIDPPLTDAERRHIAAGIGLHREQGMGWICIDPRLLAGERPRFASPIQNAKSPAPVPRPDDPLIVWLEGQRSTGEVRRGAEVQAKDQAKALQERYRLARTFAGIPDRLPVGPSPAQWGNIYEAARTATDLNTLRTALFQGDNAICKPRAENWQDQFRDGRGVRSFRDWLQDDALVKPSAERDRSQEYAVPPMTSVQALRLFGREAQRIAQREHGRVDRQEA